MSSNEIIGSWADVNVTRLPFASIRGLQTASATHECSLLRANLNPLWEHRGLRFSVPTEKKLVELDVQGLGPFLQHLKRWGRMPIFDLG